MSLVCDLQNSGKGRWEYRLKNGKENANLISAEMINQLTEWFTDRKLINTNYHNWLLVFLITCWFQLLKSKNLISVLCFSNKTSYLKVPPYAQG